MARSIGEFAIWVVGGVQSLGYKHKNFRKLEHKVINVIVQNCGRFMKITGSHNSGFDGGRRPGRVKGLDISSNCSSMGARHGGS